MRITQNRKIKNQSSIDLFTDRAAIWNSIVSNSYYGMLMGHIIMYSLPEYPIIAIYNNKFKRPPEIH